MMQQYMEIKSQHEDSILFFRLGDFYEMFYKDAQIASEELDLTLTGKDCGQEERAPMCGVPYHSCEAYIARLVEKGYRVAICEQMEDPATAKGLVKRDVVRVITPGTIIEESMLEEGKNNFLAAVSLKEKTAGICFVDVSTGALHLTEASGDRVEQRIIDELSRFSPRELLIADVLEIYPVLSAYLQQNPECRLTYRPGASFDPAKTEERVLAHFHVISVENLGLAKGGPAVAALGAVFEYLYETKMQSLSSLQEVHYYTESQYMRLDLTALRNLELCETMRSKSKRGSLLWVLDKTKTAMGKRLMHSWLEQPLVNIAEITARQNAVDELYSETVLRGELIEALGGIHDIERLISRVGYGTGGPRELRSLAESSVHLPTLKKLLSGAKSRMLSGICDRIDELQDIKDLIMRAIVDNPPVVVREGKMIRDGYNEEVDQLRHDIEHGTDVLAEVEATERERTGIRNLKVRYNRVFGYYIEVSNSFLDRVPEDYIRKQTLTNGERFITDELKRIEARVLGAKERIVQLEYQLFEEVRNTTAKALDRFMKTASAIASLDVLCSFAEVAVQNSYTRPHLNSDGVLQITAGRHPVVERVLRAPFVANDTLLDNGDNRCAIITGPNMAGKSTYMRQVAIITLMAQIGSFVPAESANICVTDAIFTRVGASDDLASGQSTFMVEMSEVAYILKNATKQSLLILDEIGRGTSTFDGMSIARAVLEYVADKKKLGAKTLFSTHYHELTQLEEELQGVKNYNVSVKKRGDDIIFLRRIVRGGADDSYGIEVAKLSGLPSGIIDRAKQILKQVEADGIVVNRKEVAAESQLPLEMREASALLEELKALDVNTLTPIEAMQTLFALSAKAKSV